MKLRRYSNPDSGLVHHYSQGTPPKPSAYMQGYLAGYEKAGAQYREGKRIAKPLDTWQRAVFMTVVLVATAAVTMTAAWVVQ